MSKRDDPTNSTDAESGETFVGRWSRRKRAGEQAPSARPEKTEASTQAKPDALHTPALPAEQAEPLAPLSQAEAGAAPLPETGDIAPVLSDADMPDLATIGDDGDYSGFMSPGVSEGLRNKALRQLFMSPQFNVLDGLNDYDDDFTKFEPLGDIVTSDMRHRVEMEAERAAREAEAQRVADEAATDPLVTETNAEQQPFVEQADAEPAPVARQDPEHEHEHEHEHEERAHPHAASASALPAAEAADDRVDEGNALDGKRRSESISVANKERDDV